MILLESRGGAHEQIVPEIYQKVFMVLSTRYLWGTSFKIGYKIDPRDVENASAESRVDIGSYSDFKRNSD